METVFCKLKTPSAHQDSINLTRPYKILHTTEKCTQKMNFLAYCGVNAVYDGGSVG